MRAGAPWSFDATMSKRPPVIRCIAEALSSPSRKAADFKKASGSRPRRGERDACAGAGKGRRTEQSGDPSNAGGYGGAREVQRGAGQGGRRRRGWPPLPERGGKAGSVRRQEAHRDRRAVRGGQGGGGRVLAVAGGARGRGHRMAQTGPPRRRGPRESSRLRAR